MSFELRLDVYSPDGTERLDRLTAVNAKSGYLDVACSKQVNRAGMLAFTLQGEHRLIPRLQRNCQIELWWRDLSYGIDWLHDFTALYEESEHETLHPPGLFTAYCPGALSLLGQGADGYPAETANRNLFTAVAAETVLKTYVRSNVTSEATTANKRRMAGPDLGIVIAPDLGRGPLLSQGIFGKNVLDVLQNLVPQSGGDIDLIKIGNRAWEFRYYPGQRGTDRRTDLTFALERGNMVDPHLEEHRTDQKTVALVAGRGERVERRVRVRYATDYTPQTHREINVDADDINEEGLTDAQIDALLDARGDAALQQARAYESFKFTVRQTKGYAYGRDYFLGDIGMAGYRGREFVQKVQAVTIALGANGAAVRVQTETL
jgi:hypothetical protein